MDNIVLGEAFSVDNDNTQLFRNIIYFNINKFKEAKPRSITSGIGFAPIGLAFLYTYRRP